MDVPPRKRRGLQVCLTTAVVMMAVTGGIIGLNFTPILQKTMGDVRFDFYGFPIPALVKLQRENEAAEFHHTATAIRETPSPFRQTVDDGLHPSIPYLFDGCFLIVAVAGSGWICEWWIRRLEAKKP